MKKLTIAAVAFLLVGAIALHVAPPHWEFAGLTAQVVAKPVPACRLEIEGVTVPVTNISDFKVECEVVEFYEGDELTPRKLPGKIKYGDITFKSNVLHKVEGVDVKKWYQEVLLGQFTKKSGALVLYDPETGEEYHRYKFYEAWPCKWSSVRMVGSRAVIPIEEFTLAVEKIDLAR